MALSDESKRLWEEVKANSAKLNACRRHRFEYEAVKIGQRIECAHCGGKLQLTDAGMYVRGYIAAGGNPEDVWPGWDRKRG